MKNNSKLNFLDNCRDESRVFEKHRQFQSNLYSFIYVGEAGMSDDA